MKSKIETEIEIRCKNCEHRCVCHFKDIDCSIYGNRYFKPARKVLLRKLRELQKEVVLLGGNLNKIKP